MSLILKEYRFCCKNGRAECISNINVIDKVIEILKSHSDEFYIRKNISITKEELCEKLNTAKDENAIFEMYYKGLIRFSIGSITYFNGNFRYGKIVLCIYMNYDKSISSFDLKFDFDGLTFVVLICVTIFCLKNT